MMYSSLIESITMGILLGGVYVVMGIGLSLVFGVMRLVNLAHGDFIILASYLSSVFLFGYNMDPVISLLITFPTLFAMGFGIYRALIYRSSRMGMEAPLLITFGISIILQNLFLLIWTPMPKSLTTDYVVQAVKIGPYSFPLVYLMDLFAGLLTATLIHLFLKHTYIGLAIRASSMDMTTAELMGINTRVVQAFTMGLAAGLAAVSGVFIGLTFPFTPSSGVDYLITAFGVVVVGGLGSIAGTVAGGMILGISQTLAGTFLGAGWQQFIGYLVIIVTLSLRPEGIFGRSKS